MCALSNGLSAQSAYYGSASLLYTGMGYACTQTATSATTTACSNSLLSSMKLLGPAASIDLGNTPLTHRNYNSTLKGGFTFRRSFDEKIITGVGVGAGSAGVTLLHLPSVSQAPQLFPHNSVLQHVLHPATYQASSSGSGSVGFIPSFSYQHHIGAVSPARSNGNSACSSLLGSLPTPVTTTLGSAVLRHSSDVLTSSQSTTKLYRDDYLQQTAGYLPTTRIFRSNASSTITDDDKSQADFLSLSLSPPLNRRRDMPALRGPFISL